MARIDAYLRSLERFGAQAVILQSDQSVTLRFATGDRHATQVTPHDQLVAMVREVAPPAALDLIDGGRPARFDLTGAGGRFLVAVAPRGAQWVVQIEPETPPAAAAGAHPDPVARAAVPAPVSVPPSGPTATAAEMTIERTAHEVAAGVTGSWLDEAIRAARVAGASDLHLSAGARPTVRIGGDLGVLPDRTAIDGEALERELESALPGVADRAAELPAPVHVVPGIARCRVRVFRDRRGLGAALRLHPIDPPDPELLGMPLAALALTERRRGLVLIASPAGGGRTTTMHALIEHVAARASRVVSIERAAEVVHGGRNNRVSQRQLGEHVLTAAAALTGLADEDADVVAVDDLPDDAAVDAALDLALAGRLVLAGVAAPTTTDAVERIVARARSAAAVAGALVGATAQVLCKRQGGGQVAAFEVLVATDAAAAALRQGQVFQLPSLIETGRGLGMIGLVPALYELVRGRAITAEEALARAPDPAQLRALAGAGAGR
jgi:twitching motility protein PilT